MNTEFKPVNAGDLDALAAFAREYHEHDQLHTDPAVVRGVLAALLDAPSLGRAWFVCVDGAPVGYVVVTRGFSIEHSGPSACVDELYVRPDFRGKGLGATAMQFVEAECAREGIRSIQMEVEPRNDAAHDFYLAAGYVDLGRTLMIKLLPSKA
ncbi:MAG TPA: GNAT family N-acetyltransferase [Kiritimatiellia bacterium]|jgi:GNAT superfamily N-acetyltransferase